MTAPIFVDGSSGISSAIERRCTRFWRKRSPTRPRCGSVPVQMHAPPLTQCATSGPPPFCATRVVPTHWLLSAPVLEFVTCVFIPGDMWFELWCACTADTDGCGSNTDQRNPQKMILWTLYAGLRTSLSAASSAVVDVSSSVTQHTRTPPT